MTLSLSEADLQELTTWVRRGSTPQKQALRARIILMTAEGVPSKEIALQLRTTAPTIMLWRRRFLEAGVA
ncbi:helix-turn-helix domain-containing protein, partial [Chitinilyticum litopenaei]